MGVVQHEPNAVTIVILARNEKRTIGQVIADATEWCRDVLVMDGHSSDGTADAARKGGARVVTDSGKGKGAAIRQSLELCVVENTMARDIRGGSPASERSAREVAGSVPPAIVQDGHSGRG